MPEIIEAPLLVFSFFFFSCNDNFFFNLFPEKKRGNKFRFILTSYRLCMIYIVMYHTCFHD